MPLLEALSSTLLNCQLKYYFGLRYWCYWDSVLLVYKW